MERVYDRAADRKKRAVSRVLLANIGWAEIEVN